MSFFFSNFFIWGSRRDDSLIGTNSRNIIYGSRGDDYIDGRGGHDMLFGGNGHDTIYGGSGRDFLFGDRGNDFLDGGSGHDHVSGGRGQDQLNWTASENYGSRADWYSGGSGRDTLIINLTGAEYTESVRLEILEYIDFIAANVRGNGQANGRNFSFDSINLNVSSVEFVQIVVDGTVVDPAAPPNTAPAASDVEAAADEDSAAITVTADFTDADAGDVHAFTVDTAGTVGTVIRFRTH